MQFRDLKKQYEVLKTKMDQQVLEVMSSAHYINGPQVKELEAKLAAYVGKKHCITCGNGTDALTLALKTWGVTKGDAVFIADFTFFASAEVVSFEGATPIFVDVDKDSYNMSATALELAIKKVIEDKKLKPKAIIAVDLFGLPADYTKIMPIARRYNLKVLEDGAQGFGGEINGQKACSFGDIAATSFFPAKPIGCYGDGGAVFTDNDNEAELIRSYCVHGKGKEKYDNVRIGINSRLDTIQAAILLVKLEAFQEYELEDINKAANQYTKLLKGNVITPVIPEGFLSSWAQYTIQLESEEERTQLQEELKEQGIPTMIYYPKPMHLQEAFADLKIDRTVLRNSEELCKTVLALPMHPYMETKDIRDICNRIINRRNC